MTVTDNTDLTDALREAAVWGMTLVLSQELLKIAENTGVKRNRFYIDSNLATPANTATGINVDTIYGFAWIDLTNGPQVIEVPDTADRYYSIQLMDAYLQTIAYVGRRATGTQAGTYLLTGPGWLDETHNGLPKFELPTNLVFVLARMQVRDAQDPADLAEARQLLGGLSLGPLAEYPGGRIAPLFEDDATGNRFPVLDLVGMGAEYFDCLCGALTTQPPPAADRELLERFTELGIGPGLQPSRNPEIAPYLEEVLKEAVAEIRNFQMMKPLGNGPWITPTGVRTVGSLDPKVRACFNIDAPGGHPVIEAVYAALVFGEDGAFLTGENAYRLHFPPGGFPPVNAFWSVTMYAVPGQRLVENPINRYAIGSNFESALKYGEDGSLDILLQRECPGGDANWLPTPPGQFMLICRMYQSGPDLINGKYGLPAAILV